MYVDGFVLAVPKKKLTAYKKMATGASKIWIEHGALEYREAVSEDDKAPMGLPFSKLSKAKTGETVVFAWITYKSRKHRDSVNKKVMKDPRINEICPDPKNMPFDCARMAYGGFDVMVAAEAKKKKK